MGEARSRSTRFWRSWRRKARSGRAYALKLLQSEGELTIASTGKDPATGRLVTQEYRVRGPVMIFLTTTAIDVDEELLNRCLVLTVDEGREQTRAIHERQRRGAKRWKGCLREARAGSDADAAPERAAADSAALRGESVRRASCDFPITRRGTRRDHMKYLALIEAIALLAPVPAAGEGGGAPRREDPVHRGDAGGHRSWRTAWRTRCSGGASTSSRRRRGGCSGWSTRWWRRSASGSGSIGVIFALAAVRCGSDTGWGDTQLRVHLGRLVELEYVLVHRGGARAELLVRACCTTGAAATARASSRASIDADELDDASTTATSRGRSELRGVRSERSGGRSGPSRA